MDGLDVKNRFNLAWKYARLYGGAAIFLNVDDGVQSLEEPINLANVRSLRNLTVLNRYELTVSPSDIQADINEPGFGEPELYTLASKTAAKEGLSLGVKIHKSRLIIFQGIMLPRLLYIANGYWHDSIFTALWDSLRDFNIGHSSIANIIQDYRIFIYKLDGLKEIFAGGKEDQLKSRLETMNLARSVMSTYFMAKETEDFDVKTMNVGGIDKLMRSIKERFQAATEIPHTLLFNESPSGLGATGKSEDRMWYDAVKSKQTNYLSPKLDEFFGVFFSAKTGPTRGQMPEEFDYDWVSLYQMTEKEVAEIEKFEAEADDLRISSGVLGAQEVRERRYTDQEGEAPTPEEEEDAIKSDAKKWYEKHRKKRK